MPAHDLATLEFYAGRARDYVANIPAQINCDLPGFLVRLAPGAAILELGCGVGRDAEFMAAKGFCVDATDGVPAMAELAEQRLGRTVRVMRFDELAAVQAYDAIYASYALLHVPRSGLDDVLRRVWTALRPGGWHMATFKSGGREGRDELGRWFNYLEVDQARAHYAAAGRWDPLEFSEGEGAGFKGRVSPWVNVIGRKPAT